MNKNLTRTEAEYAELQAEVERQAVPITVALLFWLFRNPVPGGVDRGGRRFY